MLTRIVVVLSYPGLMPAVRASDLHVRHAKPPSHRWPAEHILAGLGIQVSEFVTPLQLPLQAVRRARDQDKWSFELIDVQV